MINKIVYLGYYLKNLDRPKFFEFVDYVTKEHKISRTKLYTDIIGSVWKYNTSFLEYFQFGFYSKPKELRSTYASTVFMYEYQLKMNPKNKRAVLQDKLLFLDRYKEFAIHDSASLVEMEADHSIAQRLLDNVSGKIVLKGSDGQCGWGIEVRDTNDFTPDTLIARLKEIGNDIVEEFIQQHPEMDRMSPSGLNTVRVITQLDKNNNVVLLGTILRISINSVVDNMAAGNIAAPVNPETGIVEGDGVYGDITKADEKVHPVTGVTIKGFQIPYWDEVLDMVKRAAMVEPGNRSIGWDVAITQKGPQLIEGNHNWCKLVWQMPVKKGLKHMLIPFEKGVQ